MGTASSGGGGSVADVLGMDVEMSEEDAEEEEEEEEGGEGAGAGWANFGNSSPEPGEASADGEAPVAGAQGEQAGGWAHFGDGASSPDDGADAEGEEEGEEEEEEEDAPPTPPRPAERVGAITAAPAAAAAPGARPRSALKGGSSAARPAASAPPPAAADAAAFFLSEGDESASNPSPPSSQRLAPAPVPVRDRIAAFGDRIAGPAASPPRKPAVQARRAAPRAGAPLGGSAPRGSPPGPQLSPAPEQAEAPGRARVSKQEALRKIMRGLAASPGKASPGKGLASPSPRQQTAAMLAADRARPGTAPAEAEGAGAMERMLASSNDLLRKLQREVARRAPGPARLCSSRSGS